MRKFCFPSNDKNDGQNDGQKAYRKKGQTDKKGKRLTDCHSLLYSISIFYQAQGLTRFLLSPPTHHPTHNFQSSLNKSIQVLLQHMIHFWNLEDKTFPTQQI